MVHCKILEFDTGIKMCYDDTGMWTLKEVHGFLSVLPESLINVLIVGAGGLGLWTMNLSEYYLKHDDNRVKITVADTNVSAHVPSLVWNHEDRVL